ncbi:hypothetical protein Y032_0015g2842 [Ancylostoma ceylanicum]|uniref:Uncharacterized protein n=1 Tax=Ancylostoma ceylanicum TaxID=53326 RepID=A0A016V9W4_9BILA|nr:hypothetical protein Y032_0015g2842 [Ancylostoma ceylanicum]
MKAGQRGLKFSVKTVRGPREAYTRAFELRMRCDWPLFLVARASVARIQCKLPYKERKFSRNQGYNLAV